MKARKVLKHNALIQEVGTHKKICSIYQVLINCLFVDSLSIKSMFCAQHTDDQEMY